MRNWLNGWSPGSGAQTAAGQPIRLLKGTASRDFQKNGTKNYIKGTR
jgi:hypothetical protein